MGENLTLLTDFYELTMAQGWFLNGDYRKRAVFDAFYRKNPHGGGYAVFAGLEQVVEYIENISFGDKEITYLKGLGAFTADFLDYLRDFRFSGTIHAVPEGTVIFPSEPIVRVCAPLIEAQFIETALLNIINHQSLIATKTARIVMAAENAPVMEFGLRRAQGPDAGVLGARASYVAGCVGTSNVLCGARFGVPVKGTHAHSWVMSFKDELTAFREYAKTYPDACTLLVDTFDTLKKGVPNAIKVFGEMRDAGVKSASYGIRLDSGDFAYLTKKARKMLDDAGFGDAKITVSGDLDEYLIQSLKQQGAAIDAWGVGTRLITSEGDPAFGGVYKLAAEDDGNGGPFTPKMKISDNIEKITNPGVKKIIRIYDKSSGKMKADVIVLDDETIDENRDLTLFHPLETWKKMTLSAGSFRTREPLEPVFVDGERVYAAPTIKETRDYCKRETDSLWDEYKRLINPHVYPVDLSPKLSQLRRDLIDELKSRD